MIVCRGEKKEEEKHWRDMEAQKKRAACQSEKSEAV